MPKLIHPALHMLLLLALTGVVAGAHAAQSCRSESEIPSSTPTIAFTDQGDGTVIHHATGLMWMKCPLGQSGSDCATGSATTYTWDAALEAAAASGFADYTDWRLPDFKELRSIVEERCNSPAINAAVFPAATAWYFWSSSPFSLYSYRAWGVNFGSGRSYGSGLTSANRVRLVRSAQ
jgi:hypothetical protein